MKKISSRSPAADSTESKSQQQHYKEVSNIYLNSKPNFRKFVVKLTIDCKIKELPPRNNNKTTSAARQIERLTSYTAIDQKQCDKQWNKLFFIPRFSTMKLEEMTQLTKIEKDRISDQNTIDKQSVVILDDIHYVSAKGIIPSSDQQPTLGPKKPTARISECSAGIEQSVIFCFILALINKSFYLNHRLTVNCIGIGNKIVKMV